MSVLASSGLDVFFEQPAAVSLDPGCRSDGLKLLSAPREVTSPPFLSAPVEEQRGEASVTAGSTRTLWNLPSSLNCTVFHTVTIIREADIRN